jgi:hypothetical protein
MERSAVSASRKRVSKVSDRFSTTVHADQAGAGRTWTKRRFQMLGQNIHFDETFLGESCHGDSMVRPWIRQPGNRHIAISNRFHLAELVSVQRIEVVLFVLTNATEHTLKTLRRFAISSKAW